MGWDDYKARQGLLFDTMKANDEEAKARGELIGRYIQETIADGYAYYVIVGHTARTVKVEHQEELADGYTIPMIESMGGVIPVKYARENIHWRDQIAELL